MSELLKEIFKFCFVPFFKWQLLIVQNLPWMLFKAVRFIWKSIGTLPLRICTAQYSRQLPIAALSQTIPSNKTQHKAQSIISKSFPIKTSAVWNLKVALPDFEVLEKQHILLIVWCWYINLTFAWYILFRRWYQISIEWHWVFEFFCTMFGHISSMSW